MLAALVRRRIRHHHQLRAGAHGVGQRLGEPQVLADQQADRHTVDLEHAAAAIRIDIEVAALVEHRVVGQLALAVGLLDQPVAQHAGSVVDHRAGRLWPANHGGDATAGGSDAGHRLLALVQEARAQQQVLRRGTAHRQLGEHHQLGAVLVARLADHLDDALGVAGDIADREVELRHRDADRSHGNPACGCNAAIVALRHARAGHAMRGWADQAAARRRKAALQNRLPEAVVLISPAWRWQRPGRPASGR